MKAQVVPEYEDIEAIQDAMAVSLMAEWTALSEAGILAGVAHLDGIESVTDEDIEAAIKLVGAPLAKGWLSKDAIAMINEGLEGIWKLSQNVILNKAMGTAGYDKELVFKANLDASFDIVDMKALEHLGKQQVTWLEEHQDLDTQWEIQRKGMEELRGAHGERAGEQLKKAAEKIHGVGAFDHKGMWYFQGVAVNAATTARVSSSILEMEELGIKKYTIVNPMDERTTDICAALNGKTFSVTLAADKVREELDITTKADMKDAHPWNPGGFQKAFKGLGVKVTPGKSISSGAAATLSAAGYGLPPYHFKCRTTVDVESQGKVPKASPPAAGDAPKKKKPKKPKKPKLNGRQKVFGNSVGDGGTAKPDRWLLQMGPSAELAGTGRATLDAIQNVRDAMARIPKVVATFTRKNKCRVYIERWITDRWTHLKGVRPRGWAVGRTWRIVGGGASGTGTDSIVAIGSGIQGGIREAGHTALHEWGHTMDKLGRNAAHASGGILGSQDFSDQAWWIKHHKKAIKKPTTGPRHLRKDPLEKWYTERHGWGNGTYFRQAGHAGRQEFWAEMMAEAYWSPRSRMLLDKHFPGLLDDMGKQIAKQWKL
jgi:hypothetical protein